MAGICLVHIVIENVIQVKYVRPYDFRLGYFSIFYYYWLGSNLLQYHVKVYLSGRLQTEGRLRHIVLEQESN